MPLDGQTAPAAPPTFDVSGARAAGYSDSEIAGYLGSTTNFNVAGARRAGYSDDEIIAHLAPPPPPPENVSSMLGGISQAINQAPTDIAGGLIQGVGAMVKSAGTGLQAAAGVPQAVADLPLNAARNAQNLQVAQLGIMNRVDAGETVPAMDDPLGYGDASPEQRATIKQRLEGDIAAMPAPEDTTAGQASAALQPVGDAGRAGMEAAGGGIKVAGDAIMGAGAGLTKLGETYFPLTAEEQARISVHLTKMGAGLLEYVAAGATGGPAAMVALAGTQGFGDHYKAAKAAGASDDKAAIAGVLGFAVDGGMMTVPLHKAIDLAGSLPTKLMQGQFLSTVLDMAKSGTTMTAFSQLQKVADNVVAQQLYAPDRKITEGVGNPQEMGLEFATGAALPGSIAAARFAGRMAYRGLVGNVGGIQVGGAGQEPVAPSPQVLAAPDVDSAIDAARQATQAASPGAPPAESMPPPESPPIPATPPAAPESATRSPTPPGWSGAVEQAANGDYQFRQTDAAGMQTVHPIVPWDPDTAAPAAADSSTISPDTATAIRDHYAQAGLKTVFYQPDPALPFDGAVDPAHPDTLFLSNEPSRNVAQVAGHEFTHVLQTTTLPDGSSLGELLNQQVAAGITPAGQRYAASTFGDTAPDRGSFPAGAEGAAAHAAAVQAHLVDQLGADIGGEAPKFQSFIPRVMDAIQARFGNNVAGDVLRKMMDGLQSAMDTIRGLFGETGTRSQNWVTNIGEIHDTLAQMYAQRFGTPVERDQANLAAAKDRAERDRFVAAPEAAKPLSDNLSDVSDKLSDAVSAPTATETITRASLAQDNGTSRPEELSAAGMGDDFHGRIAAAVSRGDQVMLVNEDGKQVPLSSRDGHTVQASDGAPIGWIGALSNNNARVEIRPAADTPSEPSTPTPSTRGDAPGFHEVQAAAHGRTLQLRRWLDQLRDERHERLAASARAAVLRHTEAAILRPVAGNEAALPEAGQARLDQVRTQIDAATHPADDTPAMATVRAALTETPAGQAAAKGKAAVRGPNGDFGNYSMFTPGARLTSDSGRPLAPVPEFGDPNASNRAFSTARKKIDRWLINEARAEALAKGDKSLADRLARETVDNFPPASRDMAMDTVFGDERGPQARHAAEAATAPASVKPSTVGSPGPIEHPGLVVTSPRTGKTTVVQPPGTVPPLVSAGVDRDAMPRAPADAAQGETWWKNSLTANGRQMALDAAGLKAPATTAWQYLTVAQRARLLAANQAPRARPTAAAPPAMTAVAGVPPAPTDPINAVEWWNNLDRRTRKSVLEAAGLKAPATTAWGYLSVSARKRILDAYQPAPETAAAPPPEAPPPESTATPEPERDARFTQEPPESAIPPEPDRGAGYGADNKTFTADMAAKARARLREKLNRLNAGFDPEMMLDGLTLAGFHIEAGARTFAEYSKRMFEDIGEGVRPFLAHFYGSVREYPGFDNRGMDDRATVDAELERNAQAATKAVEARDDGTAEVRDGGLDQSGGGEAGQAGGLPGQPARNRRAGRVEARPAGDVSAVGQSSAEAGLRPGGKGLSVDDAVSQVGDAAAGRSIGSSPGVAVAGAGAADRPVPASVRPNFHIDDPDRLIGGTPKVRFARNRAAVEALAAIEEDQREPTPTELQALAGYIGWGSFGQDLFQGTFERQLPRQGWDAESKWLRDHLGKDAWESAQRSIINAHYTDPPTVKAMWDMVQRMGFKGGRVLEPSMGIGNFFGMMPRDMMAASSLTGIELDRLSAQMAKLLYPVAGIHQKGYQDSKTPDGFYDLVIGNWPFAAQGPADRRYNRLSPTLHDYFFLKALDQTRPGGLVVGITSAGTMDKVNRSARIEMAKKGELLGAFRLPSGAFEKYAGTQVVTDIIVFRKRTEPVTDVLAEPWIDASETQAGGHTIRVNNYFQAHPDAVLGTFGFGRGLNGRQAMTVERPADFAQRLAGLANRLPKDGFAPVLRGNEPRFVSNNTIDRQGSITTGEDGKLYQVAGERLLLLEDVAKQMRTGTQKAQKALVDQVGSLVKMRRSYGALIDAERDGRPETEDVRQSLAKQYEAFTAAHGPLQASRGLALLEKQKDPAFGALAALVRPDGTPSQILSEPTTRSRRSIDNPSLADAYVVARNEKATVDVDRVAELAKKPRETVEHELLSSGAIMRTPGGGFEAKDVYLSGNVRRKLREAQDALANGDDMQASVDALTNALPPTVPYYQIEAKLGAPWAGDDTYKAFLGDVLGLQGDALDQVRVRFAGSRWRVTFADRNMNFTPEAMQVGHPDYRFDKLVQAAMGNNVITIRKRDKDGTYVDTAATEEVNAKVQALRERFQDWAWADAERKVRLEGAYNDAMNAIAKPRYDGSFMDLSGMALRRGTDPFSLRKHQMDAIWRGVITGRGLFAHEVGTGKSYTMAGIAVEGRRYGVFRKPLVLAHNANSAAVAQEFQDMYPGGKFLYINNLAPDVIATELHRIANEDWDAVIMPHSLIDRMTLTRETLTELAADQITDLENEAMEAAKEDGAKLTPEMMDDAEAMAKVRSITAKQLVKQREAIIANIEKQANRASKEGAVAFEKLGVDAVIVDEAHEFKKPPIATRMQLKGLNTAVSARSIALDFLTGYVNKQGNGRGTYLFTGTPVTNALNEVFNMARYFMRDRMEADGVKDWDAWFNTFADAVSDVELTSGGGYEPVKRLSAFVNVDELVRQMSEFTDVVQAKDMPEFVPRETADGKTMTSPGLTPEGRDYLQNGRAENPVGRPYKKILTNVADMSPDQRAILDELQNRARVFKNATGQAKRDLVLEGEMLKINNGLRAAVVDARMYNPDAADDPNSKVNRIAAKVLEHYQEDRAAQAIFVDTGYNVQKTSEGRADRFVLVRDLIDKLAAGGIPRKEIKIVAGGITAEKKKEIADAMNAGTVRVTIGQSGTMGVGVNMQTNLRAMHHMDAPWRPGDLEQRNGRGERQGNEWNTVLEYRYVTEGIDGRGWQILTTKDRFIKQFISAFNDTSGKRLGNIEGDAADIGESEDILTTLGEAAGDPRIMLRAKYAADVTRLERRERMHTLGQADAAQKARTMRRALADQKISNAADAAKMATYQEAADRAEVAAKAAGDTRRWYEATIDGQELNTGPDIQAALDRQVEALRPGDTKAIGTLNGHEISVRYPVGRTPTFFYVGSPMEAPTLPRLTGAVTALRNRVAYAAKPGNYEESVLRLEAAADEPFPRQADLLQKRQQLANLVDDLQANPVPPPGWLRHGAPLDSTIYVDGQPRIVRGHRMTDDYKLLTDEGEVSYRRVRDENGNQVYEVHAPPEQPADKTAAAVDGEDLEDEADPGATQFSPKITGAQRESTPYTDAEKQAYANVGRITDAPSFRQRLVAARKDIGRRTIAAVLDPYIGVKADDPAGYMALRNANTTSGALLQFMTDGTLRFEGSAYAMADRNGGVEHNLIRPLQGEENRFIWWVAANRAERLSAEDRENLWTAADIATLKGTNQGTVGFDYTLPNGTVTRSREAIYLDSLRKLDVFNRNTLELATQAGLIGSGAASTFLANPFYVPFYRQPEGEGRFSGGSIQAGFVKQYAFKSLKGGTEKLNHDLWENAIGNWSHMIDASLRNRAAAGVLDVGVTNGAVIEVTPRDYGYMSKRDKESVVWVMNGGQRQMFQVTDPMLFTAISALDFSSIRNPVMDALTKFKTALTMGVTADPRFMLRVFIKDAEQAVAVAPQSANLVANVYRGLQMSNFAGALGNVARTVAGQEAQRVRLSDEAADAIAGGATMHLGSGHDTGHRKVDVDTMLNTPAAINRFWGRMAKIARATKELSAQAEDVQRLAIYHKLIAEGVPHDQAAFAGRDMEDFTLKGAGALVRLLTQTVPFLNAMMQGLYKVGRSAASADRNIGVAVGKRVAYGATRRVAAVLAVTALATLALDALYADDEDYKKRTDDDRNTHFWFKIGGTVFRLPMGFEVAAMSRIATNGVEAMFGASEMTGRRFINNVGSILASNLYMDPTPQAVAPLLDLARNRNSQGNAIVSQREAKLQAQQQYTPETTLLARGLSSAGSAATRAIGGPGAQFLAPVQIDYLANAYFGWLGSTVMTVADVAVRTADQAQAAMRGVRPMEPVRADRDLISYVTGGMVGTETTAQSRYVNMLYEQAGAVNRAFDTYHDLLARRLNLEAKDYLDANKPLIAKHPMIAALTKTEATLGAQIRRVETSPTLTAAEKHDQVMRFEALRNKAAENIFGPRREAAP